MSPFTHRLPHQPWGKPSRNEEEYFHLLEFRERMAAARRRERARTQEDRRRVLELHRNRCPRCGGRLEAIHVKEGRAEQCPNCLGVWLDHDMFDRLTHPAKDNRYLTSIFRDVMLQYTTGDLPRERLEAKED